MSIPAPYRTTLRNGAQAGSMALVMRPSHNYPCVEAWPAETFERLLLSLDKMPVFSADDDDLTNTLYAEACEVEPDKEGRIVVPDILVRHAGLTDSVTFMGHGHRFEVWEPEAALRRAADARSGVRERKLTVPGLGAA